MSAIYLPVLVNRRRLLAGWSPWRRWRPRTRTPDPFATVTTGRFAALENCGRCLITCGPPRRLRAPLFRCNDTRWFTRSFARRQYRRWRFLGPVQPHYQVDGVIGRGKPVRLLRSARRILLDVKRERRWKVGSLFGDRAGMLYGLLLDITTNWDATAEV